MNWYYARGDESIGPLDDAAFQHAVATGAVTDETLVWREGMADWIPFAAAGLSATGISRPASHEGVCVECGNTFPQEDLIAYKDVQVCAGCKPLFFQRLQEGGVIPGQLRIATVGSRIAAKLVDLLLLTLIGILMVMFELLITGREFFSTSVSLSEIFFQALTSILSIVMQVAYTTWFLGRYGATPGKMALGLRVVRTDGSRITYLRGFARYWAEQLSSTLCTLGYWMALLDPEARRTLHDGICDTRVITIK